MVAGVAIKDSADENVPIFAVSFILAVHFALLPVSGISTRPGYPDGWPAVRISKVEGGVASAFAVFEVPCNWIIKRYVRHFWLNTLSEWRD